ncbi:complexin-4c [Callorhinchus milii]|uniref:Complexin 4c n=1 Tax=Callorhinchus milii TaxID=7868 RepID=A0A4W3GMN5_CALMI|nr:complexin-4c [Callorhinchus milii]|eukprot:gi/632978927/ref/XP_007906184.1/ PREDICTED: complexin-4-like [Callorhinchus milii]
MSFLLKNMLSQKMKNLSGGGGEEEKTETGDGTPTPASTGMTREEFEEYQRQLVEEKMERDNSFAQKKAERATLRVHMREKYRLPQSEKDENHIQMVGGDVDLPEDLAKMVEADEEEEEANDSFLGSIQNMDFDMFKNKAQDTFIEIKQSAEEKCSVM